MTLSQAIISTLSYYDIFNYPLKIEQIHQYLISQKVNILQVQKSINQLINTNQIGADDNYFYLKNRSKLVLLRKQRNRISKAKLKRAYFFADILKVIPTLKLVAISGALAMENSHKNDDIDLVLVSSDLTIWTTRFFSNLLLLPFKRDPDGKKVADRACLNLFLDESGLKIKTQNLYIAHEISQMKLIWDRDGAYQKFIGTNRWINKYLPNWEPQVANSKCSPGEDLAKPRKMVNRNTFKIYSPFTIHHSPVETFLKKVQLWYMRSKITTETIGKNQLFFHPQDTEKWVIEEYQKRLIKLGIQD
ncbi:hypothetical protein A3F02_01260 [Candidatus Curtissbacteria bacterium RIFCSPHIGHO2_12_FULL_38_9b]|uniref:Polymerase nucleotidyl transferase domain-containing protein n=2 Tax=Candidatus Curtissiibacteriota TaxID=1752717 RepID=A0A1F5GZN2_9BACT|nr:MAG: hypothetical protein A3A48_02800 [Candidatus Curtissbacteria bacterium RIFCSPLOWO2_01_FULL_37_9]OGD97311.1 MAG: hypothetical protein A3F02_01260 [Candidatus Curtissbacteria bacterium RIFCSPHIGHO2_12_FULL_38_9b]